MYAYQLSPGRGGYLKLSSHKMNMPSSKVRKKLPQIGDQPAREWKTNPLTLQRLFDPPSALQHLQSKSSQSFFQSSHSQCTHHPVDTSGTMSSRTALGHYQESLLGRIANGKGSRKAREISWWEKPGQIVPKLDTDIPHGHTIQRPGDGVTRGRRHNNTPLGVPIYGSMHRLEPLPEIDTTSDLENQQNCANCQSVNCDAPTVTDIHNVPANSIMPSITQSRLSSPIINELRNN